jgi:rare lipoprotein A
LFLKPMPTQQLLCVFTLAGVVLALTTSCSGRKTATRAPQTPQSVVKSVAIGSTEQGIASWYGHPYHGRRAANGEVFDMNTMTAAHRTMPFGTWVRVDNQSNGKSVKVRITDRGPFVGDRIIDLSRRAAEEIAMIGPGITKVKLTVIEAPRGEVVEKYGVQIAAWAERKRAVQLKQSVQEEFGETRITERDGEPVLYRVVVGAGTREEAEQLLRKLREKGHSGFVTRHVP